MSIPGVITVADLSEELDRLYDRPNTRPIEVPDAMRAALAGLTWDQLVAEEPALANLLAEASRRSSVPWDDRWYGLRGHFGIKPRMMLLVGFDRPELDWLLSSSDAYDVAYRRLLRAVEDSSNETPEAESAP